MNKHFFKLLAAMALILGSFGQGLCEPLTPEEREAIAQMLMRKHKERNVPFDRDMAEMTMGGLDADDLRRIFENKKRVTPEDKDAAKAQRFTIEEIERLHKFGRDAIKDRENDVRQELRQLHIDQIARKQLEIAERNARKKIAKEAMQKIIKEHIKLLEKEIEEEKAKRSKPPEEAPKTPEAPPNVPKSTITPPPGQQDDLRAWLDKAAIRPADQPYYLAYPPNSKPEDLHPQQAYQELENQRALLRAIQSAQDSAEVAQQMQAPDSAKVGGGGRGVRAALGARSDNSSNSNTALAKYYREHKVTPREVRYTPLPMPNTSVNMPSDTAPKLFKFAPPGQEPWRNETTDRQALQQIRKEIKKFHRMASLNPITRFGYEGKGQNFRRQGLIGEYALTLNDDYGAAIGESPAEWTNPGDPSFMQQEINRRAHLRNIQAQESAQVAQQRPAPAPTRGGGGGRGVNAALGARATSQPRPAAPQAGDNRLGVGRVRPQQAPVRGAVRGVHTGAGRIRPHRA